MAHLDRLSGNEAVAVAMRQIDPDVMGAFPITPSTEIPQYFAQYVADGKVHTELVTVESEHSSMSVCIGAAAAGGRAISATSSCGLALMYELLYVAASSRLPIVLAVSTRALSGPININNDHSDAMGARDAGWIQIYAENNQEVYDNYVQAFPIAEAVRLPVMICMDGFITSHAVENIELLEDGEVKDFVGEYHPEHSLLKAGETMAVGPYDVTHYYFEHKKQEAEAMKDAKQAILDQGKRFGDQFGRTYGFFEEYCMEDAEEALVLIGSTAGTAKAAVDQLRAQGKKVGLLKIRCMRPFPAKEIVEIVKNAKFVGVLEKDVSFGFEGVVYTDVSSALKSAGVEIPAANYVGGLGGRSIYKTDIEKIYEELLAGTAKVGEASFVNLRRDICGA